LIAIITARNNVIATFACSIIAGVHSWTTSDALNVGCCLTLISKKWVVANLNRYSTCFITFGRWATGFAAWNQLIALQAFVSIQGIDDVVAPASSLAIWFPAHIGSAFGTFSVLVEVCNMIIALITFIRRGATHTMRNVTAWLAFSLIKSETLLTLHTSVF